VVSFLLAFPPISYTHSSSPPFVLHDLPTSSSLTKSTSYEAHPFHHLSDINCTVHLIIQQNIHRVQRQALPSTKNFTSRASRGMSMSENRNDNERTTQGPTIWI
jgi:hypothetical protein